jgi:uncharacterized repeat protein (TIGR02543 family)
VIHELGGRIWISLPYTLKPGELAENVKVFYIPETGDPQRVNESRHANSLVTFPTNHLSLWSIRVDDPSAPKLSAGKLSRVSASKAKIDFSVDEAGSAYYTTASGSSSSPSAADVANKGKHLGDVSAGKVSGKSVDVPKGDKYVFVVVKDAAGNVSPPLRLSVVFSVKFNGNGGKASKASANKAYLSTVGKLPSATRKGYSLKGWYTGKSSKSKVSESKKVSKDVTYYAQWYRSGKIAKVSSAKLRKSASASASVKSSVKKGKKVVILSKKGSWYRVKSGTKTGYVQKKYVKLTATK